MRLTFDFIVLCMVAAYAAAAHVSTVEDRGVPQKAHLQEGNGKIIPEEYIVIFKEQTSDDTVNGHMSELKESLIQSVNTKHRLMHEYNIGSFHGYAARMDEDTLEKVRSMTEVAFVEKNQEVHVMLEEPCEKQQTTPPWGLGRTTSRNPLSEDNYSYHKNGQGQDVYVYVIDTGIETIHRDFDNGRRAFCGADFINNPSPGTDLNGHGTHVAGTAVGTEFGIAKRAIAVAVRVLGANGTGSTDGVIAGVNWVAADHEHRNGTNKKSVCNMSVGGGKSTALNNAVAQAIGKGVHFSVAAGNSIKDACTASPASTPEAVTVGASDRYDQFAWFSNWGRCVDIIAPGVDVTSAWISDSMNTISGTSMAAPHVAGVMAKILSLKMMTPAEMSKYLAKISTKNKIAGVHSSTPNRLVYKSCP